MGIEPEANELMCLELIHHLVEMLDRYFGNVCELDLIFNFTKVQMMVDELIMSKDHDGIRVLVLQCGCSALSQSR